MYESELYFTVSPDSYMTHPSLKGQNPHISKTPVNAKLAAQQHANLRKHLPQGSSIYFKVKPQIPVPDLVYIASAGLSLPRLPEPVVVLPHFKYKSRQSELPFIEEIMKNLQVQTYTLPSNIIFEGRAEAKWFLNGKLLIIGYGHRSTKETVVALRSLLRSIYTSYKIEPPRVLGFELESADFYHFDLAIVPYSENACILHSRAFTQTSIDRLRKEIQVTVINTTDPFALNSIILENSILVHKLQDPELKKTLECITKKDVKEIDLSEFEKGGGSAACLLMIIYYPQANGRTR
jgi:N-dimethylarginine dimethylaminohydrolase